MLQGKKAAYYTLGCKLNFAETSTFEKKLTECGFITVDEGQQADLCLINTCSVTEMADHKCRQQIHKMVRNNPGAFVVVTGCYAQLKPVEVASIPGVSLVLGANEKSNLVNRVVDEFSAFLSAERSDDSVTSTPARYFTVKTKDISTFAPSCSRGNRTRYFLKVQDGCNYYCTYCTIPIARGNSRNAKIESLVEQAKQVAADGGREIVITGVNIGDFGKTTGETFLDLIRHLDAVEGIERYRISSIEPNLLTDEIIGFCAQSRAFMPHFHIPLQSGSDEVLQLMHRRYDKALFRHKIELIKAVMPDAFIGVDVMVGCRGEKPELFEECYDFLDSLDVTQLHVFPYSERPGTMALNIPYIVGDADKKDRSHRLLELSERKTHAFYESFIGQEMDVLFERAGKGKPMNGFTRNYIRVELPSELSLSEYDNQIIRVRLGEFNAKNNALIAHLL